MERKYVLERKKTLNYKVVKKLEKEVNIKQFVNVIKKRSWIIIVFSIIFSAFGGIYSIFFTKPLYESSTRLIVRADDDAMINLMVMINEPAFLENVVEELDLYKSPEALSGQISAERIRSSQIVKITVVDSDARVAAELANKTAEVFKQEMPKFFNFSNISILSDAKINPYPINENHKKNIILGLLIGIVIGFGLTFLLESIDNTIKSKQSAEQLLGIPVLGSISRINKKNVSIKKNKNVKAEVRRESLGTYK